MEKRFQSTVEDNECWLFFCFYLVPTDLSCPGCEAFWCHALPHCEGSDMPVCKVVRRSNLGWMPFATPATVNNMGVSRTGIQVILEKGRKVVCCCCVLLKEQHESLRLRQWSLVWQTGFDTHCTVHEWYQEKRPAEIAPVFSKKNFILHAWAA